jgi:diphthamide synthase subunit DPH2
MSYPHVTLIIDEGVSVDWDGNYSEIENPHLECLLQQCRNSLALLEAEIARRKGFVKTMKVDQCFQRMQKLKAQALVGRLNAQATENIQIAIHVLVTTQTTNKLQVYQKFLFDILRLHGRQFFFVTVASLGKHKLSNMNEDERVELLARGPKELNLTELHEIVKEFKIPHADSRLP